METIRRGSRGPLVARWQEFLGNQNLQNHPGAADGIFGAKTAAATREFQQRHGLVADGVVGPMTWAQAQALGFGGGGVMIIEANFEATAPNGTAYLSWAPRKLTLRLIDAQGRNPATVRLSSLRAIPLQFAVARTADGQPTLDIDLPQDSSPAEVWISGVFGEASTEDGDSGYRINDLASGVELASQPAMVRIRKNANRLADGERDRFLQAMADLNASGTGRFRDFRDMHVDAARIEAHFDVGFLPWHRSYLLDLERELQEIDPSVALPYWRFDEPAPQVFSTDFMGLPNSVGRVIFEPGHPFESWVTDGQLGLVRPMGFPPDARPPVIISEADTLALEPEAGETKYRGFAEMEGNPHGIAHTRFSLGSFIRAIGTAARDPLFFMLHANVDRLWAKWQWLERLRNPDDAQAFGTSDDNRVGHRLDDTMWPWNQIVTPPRPISAPGGTLAPSPLTPRPGLSPMVRDMIDYQGITAGDPLGFDYDDVPIE